MISSITVFACVVAVARAQVNPFGAFEEGFLKAIDPNCGYTVCPGCTNSHSSADEAGASPPYCPGSYDDDTVLCSTIASEVTGGSQDFARCEDDVERQLLAAGYFKEEETVSPCSAVQCDAVENQNFGTCTNTTANGNCCQWFEFAADGEGECDFNPCSYVNDGSCELSNTGGRCVWYGRGGTGMGTPGDGLTGEFPGNPFASYQGCYTSPCNNPFPNNPNECENRNHDEYGVAPYATNGSAYKCQWCKIQNDNGNNLGCQNVRVNSPGDGHVQIENFGVHGLRPCLSPWCKFYSQENTNVGSISADRSVDYWFGSGTGPDCVCATVNGVYRALNKDAWEEGHEVDCWVSDP